MKDACLLSLFFFSFSFVQTFHDSPLLLLLLQDYEYASFNPVAYDIANHFCEMAADYHSANPHILDYSKYPGIASLGELLMHGLLFFKSVWSILVQFQSSSCAILFYTTDTDEQKRFVKTYLSISGKYEFNVWIDCLNLFARF